MNQEKTVYTARGKLLLTAEYFVLDGALALALPTHFGQSMRVQPVGEEVLLWKSISSDGGIWFEARFSLPDVLCIDTSDIVMAKKLQSLLSFLLQNNRTAFPERGGLSFTTKLSFPREWGLGSSSTLIWLLADWAKGNPYDMLFATFGGSGYDIACAGAAGAVLYRLENYEKPIVEPVAFHPPFEKHLYFVYLGKKQNSAQGIRYYRKMVSEKKEQIAQLSQITEAIVACKTFTSFCRYIEQHEQIISHSLKLPLVKDRYFSDFAGSIKSLGAWGGDFILAASLESEEKVRAYFNSKGLSVFFSYKDIIKK